VLAGDVATKWRGHQPRNLIPYNKLGVEKFDANWGRSGMVRDDGYDVFLSYAQIDGGLAADLNE
jgi:hypothetical protein